MARRWMPRIPGELVRGLVGGPDPVPRWSAGRRCSRRRCSPTCSSRRRPACCTRCRDVGERSERTVAGAVPLRGAEVHRGDRARGRVARAHRAAGLPLQPHRLRLRAGRGARASSPSWSGPARRGPELVARPWPRPGSHLGPGGDPLSGRPAQPPRAAGGGHPLPRRGALAAAWPTPGVDPRRGEPGDHAPPGRRRAHRCPATRSSPSPI